MANGNPSSLPPGFQLDPVQATAQPQGLPPGFELDSAPTMGAQETQVREELASQQGFDLGRAIKGVGQRILGKTASDVAQGDIALAKLRDEAPVNQQFARDLPEIGAAPELNEMSRESMLSGFAAGLITNEAELAGALESQIPGSVVSQDPEGKVLVTFPSGGTYAVNKPGLSGQDFVQGATRLLAFLPSGRFAGTTLGPVAKTAAASVATEGALQGAEAGLGGEFNPEEVGTAGIFGAGGKVAEGLAGGAARAVQGQMGDDIVAQAAKQDIPLMTSDVRPPQSVMAKGAQQVGERIPFVGTSGQRVAQQEAREKAVDEVKKKYGDYSYSAIVDSLKNQKDKVKNLAGDRLNRFGQQLDSAGTIPTTNTNMAMERARQQLTKPGVIPDEGALKDLNTLIQSMEGAPQTFTALKENRTMFRDIIKNIDPAVRSQLTSRAKSLLQNVEKAMGLDMRRFAQENLGKNEFRQWSNANKAYFDEFEKFSKSRLKNVLDKGDVTPESATTMLFSKKPSELQSLYKSLGDDGRRNARAAIVSDMVERTMGPQGVNPTAFANELRKRQPQINAFFKGEERKSLQGLQKVLDATRRAQEAGTLTNSGQQVVPLLTGGAIVADPATGAATAATLGGLARLYESPAVRNALLRLDSTPRGSTRFEQALSEFYQVLNASAQAIRGQQTEGQPQP